MYFIINFQGSDDSDESESDSDSDFDDSGEDSEDEGVIYDLDMCPPGCSQDLYDNTCVLRERKLDIEEENTEEKRVLEVFKKDLENVLKKTKVIDASLKQAESELEEFQVSYTIYCCSFYCKW